MNKAQRNTVATWKQNQAVGRDAVVGLKLHRDELDDTNGSSSRIQIAVYGYIFIYKVQTRGRALRCSAAAEWVSAHRRVFKALLSWCPSGSGKNCTTVCMKRCCCQPVQYIDSYKYNSYGQSRIQIMSRNKNKPLPHTTPAPPLAPQAFVWNL